jgi:L-ascorbate metabolism protein UlaG (beta-lactamase superfamily)
MYICKGQSSLIYQMRREIMSQPLPTPVHITHIGGPTVLIEIGSLRILTDPTFDPAGTRYVYAPNFVARKRTDPAIALSELGAIDAILLSHDQHDDNLDPSGRTYLPQVGRVLTTPAGASRLGGNAQGVATWETVTLMGADGLRVQVTATPSRHGPAELEEAMGEVTGWILKWDGQQHGALYVSGDTVLFEKLQEIPRRHRVGTALLHLGAAHFDARGPFHLTFTAAEGAAFATELEASTVIPIHYEGWEHLVEGRDQIEQAFAEAGLEQRLRFLPFGQSVAIDA